MTDAQSTSSTAEALLEVFRSLGDIAGALGNRPPWSSDAPSTRPWWMESPSTVVQVGGAFPLDITDERRSFDRADPERTSRPVVFEPVDEPSTEGLPPLPTEPPAGWGDTGTEVLAWYSPFHQCTWDWGIYIRAYGIDVVAEELRAGGVAHINAPEAARAFLFGHEFGHFQAELLTTGAELASGRPLYLDGKHRQHSASPGWGVAEEGLCNALGRQRIPRPDTRALDGWLRRSPIGYREFARHSTGKRSASWAEAVGDITAGSPLAWSAVPGTPSFEDVVPAFLVLDGSGPGGWPGSALLGSIAVTEADSFVKDIAKSGNATAARRAWEKTKELLRSGFLHAGCHLEPIGQGSYSVRTGKGARAGLVRHAQGQWEAVMFDQQHDRLYDRMKRAFG